MCHFDPFPHISRCNQARDLCCSTGESEHIACTGMPAPDISEMLLTPLKENDEEVADKAGQRPAGLATFRSRQ